MITVKQQEEQRARQLELKGSRHFEEDTAYEDDAEIAEDTMFLCNWTLLQLTLSVIVSYPLEYCSSCFNFNKRGQYMNLAVEDLDLVGDGNDVSFNSK
jgi:hypothetical protein